MGFYFIFLYCIDSLVITSIMASASGNPLLSMPIGACTNNIRCDVGGFADLTPGATYCHSLRIYPILCDAADVCLNCRGERLVVNDAVMQVCHDVGITLEEYFLNLDVEARRGQEQAARIGGGAAAAVQRDAAAHFGGGAAAHVAAVPAVEDEMAAAIAASLATVNLDEDRRRSLVRSEYDELNMAHKQKNISGLISLLETAMPPVSARFSDVAAFLPPLNNITGENGEFMDGLRVASDSFLTSLQGSTEFDRSFESPEQKQRMVELVQELCKML